jgi:hypothetical protein
MYTKLEDWKNGWFGVELGILPDEIDSLIGQLQLLKTDHDQHFHISSDYKGSGGLGDIMVYVQSPEEKSNMERASSRALAPGEKIDDPKV